MTETIVLGRREMSGAARGCLNAFLVLFGMGLLLSGVGSVVSFVKTGPGEGFSLLFGIALLLLGFIFVGAGLSGKRGRFRNEAVFDFTAREVRFISGAAEPEGLVIPFENLALFCVSKEVHHHSSGSGSSTTVVYPVHLVTREGGEFFVTKYHTRGKLKAEAGAAAQRLGIPVLDKEGLLGLPSVPRVCRGTAERNFSAAERAAGMSRAVAVDSQGAYTAYTLRRGSFPLMTTLLLGAAALLFLGMPLGFILILVTQESSWIGLVLTIPFFVLFEMLCVFILLYFIKNYRIVVQPETLEVGLSFPGPLGFLNQSFSLRRGDITHIRLDRDEQNYKLVVSVSGEISKPRGVLLKMMTWSGALRAGKARRLFPEERPLVLWTVPVNGSAPGGASVFDLLVMEERLQSQLVLEEEIIEAVDDGV